MPGLNWKALANYKCPKCGNIMAEKHAGYECTGKSVSTCDYFITKDRFTDIVKNLQNGPKKWENDARPQKQFRPFQTREAKRRRI